MDGKKSFGISRNVFWMGLTSFFTDVASEMIYPVLPIFLTSTLGVSKTMLGLIEGLAESTASILKVFSGWFSDRIGKRKPPTVWGYALSTIGKPLLAISTSGLDVLFARFIDRLGKGVRTAPRDALIAESSPKAEVGKAFGFHRALDTFGAVIGPLAAFILLPLIGNNLRLMFLIAFIPALLAVILLIAFVKEREDDHLHHEKLPKFSLAHLSPRLKMLFLVVFLFNLGNSSNAFLILRAQSVGIALFLIPILWLMFNSVYTSLTIPAGIVSDKIGRKKVLLTGYIFYCLVYFGFAHATSALQVWILFAAYGLYYGLVDGVERAFVCDLSPEKYKGTSFGIYNGLVGIALLPASLIAGGLWQAMGPAATFSFGGALAGLAAIFLLFI